MENSTDDDETGFFTRTVIFWLIVSLITSFVFARYSKGFCAYMFASLTWIFLWVLFTQAWQMQERKPEHIAASTAASILGWAIGTFIVWKKRGYRDAFYIKTCNN